MRAVLTITVVDEHGQIISRDLSAPLVNQPCVNGTTILVEPMPYGGRVTVELTVSDD